MFSLVAPLAAPPASSALTEGSSTDPNRPAEVTTLFHGQDGINIWSKYLCHEDHNVYEGKRQLRLADLHFPAHTHLLIYGPSYMRQFEQLLLTAHCYGSSECKMDPNNSQPGPLDETCGFHGYPCEHLAKDMVTWYLGQNRSLTAVTNYAPLQLPPNSTLVQSRFDRIGDVLYAKGKTHAWIMEPHDVAWWETFLDKTHASNEHEQRSAGAEAVVGLAESYALSWSKQFWQTIRRDFGHTKLLNLRSWVEEHPADTPGAEGIERCNLFEMIPPGALYAPDDTKMDLARLAVQGGAGGGGGAKGVHLCAFVEDVSGDERVTTGPLVELASTLVARYV